MSQASGDLFEKKPEIKTDLCAGYHGGAETSAAAFEATKPRRESKRDKILNFIKSKPEGATCDEVEEALKIIHTTCSARITELKALGKLREADGFVRKTRAGCQAAIYFAVV